MMRVQLLLVLMASSVIAFASAVMTAEETVEQRRIQMINVKNAFYFKNRNQMTQFTFQAQGS